MNLGQAVAVCLYELSARGGYSAGTTHSRWQRQSEFSPEGDFSPELPQSEAGLASTSGELERLAGVVEKTMLAANYSPQAMHEANRHDLRMLLRRMALTERDTRRILGLFRRILWRLKH